MELIVNDIEVRTWSRSLPSLNPEPIQGKPCCFYIRFLGYTKTVLRISGLEIFVLC